MGLVLVSIAVLAAVITRVIMVTTTWFDYQVVVTQEEEDYCELG